MLAPAPHFEIVPRNVSGVLHCTKPDFARSTPSEAHKRGLRYERKVLTVLSKEGYLCGQWFEYLEQNRRHYCQVDAFKVDKLQLSIVEVKLRWCAEALPQLLGLYHPLLSWYYKGRRSTKCYVVCRNFDPSVPGSDYTKRVKSLGEDPGEGKVGILIWQ